MFGFWQPLSHAGRVTAPLTQGSLDRHTKGTPDPGVPFGI